MGYRPIRLRQGWTTAKPSEFIADVEDYLYNFTKTPSYESGRRLSETEAYLQGLKDMKRLSQPSATDRKPTRNKREG